jgi:LysM repeat protein
LNNLATTIKTDAGAGPIILTRDYLIAGLVDTTVTVPAGIDADLRAAFQSGQAGLTVTASPSDVSPVDPTSQSFTVTNASARFLAMDVSGGLTLTFGLEDGTGGAQTLTVAIVTRPASWTWSDLSLLAGGFPFSLMAIGGASFTFTAATGSVQAMAAALTPPAQLAPMVAIVDGLGFPSTQLALSGSLDFSLVDGTNIFLPTGTVEAGFGTGSPLDLAWLKVGTPVFGLEIQPAELQTGEDDDDEDGEEYYDQLAAAYFAVTFSAVDRDNKTIAYQLRANAEFDNVGNVNAFTFTLGASDGSGLLTPETVIGLFDNQGSFFEGTPPALQQFLGGIGLRGFSLSGTGGDTVTVTSVAAAIGADPTVINAEHPWAPFQDPTNGLVFGITDFELDWTLNLTRATDRSRCLFQTSFILFPEVFKGRTPDQNGIFGVQFNSELQFEASFDGTANLNELIAALSAGLITIPSSIVDASLSDVKLAVDVNAKSYSFSAGFDLDLNLFTLGGEPILSVTDGQLSFAAVTPTSTAGTGKTTYQAGIGGLVGVGPYYANCSVAYDGTRTPAVWDLSASLAEPIDVEALVQQFLSFGGSFQFPDFLPGTLTVTALGIDATIHSGAGAKNSYSVTGGFDWVFSLGSAFTVDTKANITLNYDAAKPSAQQYSGSVTALWDFSFLNDVVALGYSFAPDNSGTNAVLTLSWEGITATYTVDKKTLTFTLTNWSLGKLLTKLMQSLGDPYFTLTSPWDVLNKISLDGLALIIDLSGTGGATPSISAKYTLPGKIDLGFMTIDGLVFERKKVDGADKITLAISGSSVFKGNTPAEKQDWSNLLDPTKGQPVDKLPSVPGQGTSYFNMPLLALGQRVALAGYSEFADTKAAITAMKSVPSTTGDSNPVNPGASGGPKGTPYYDRNSNWMIGTQLQFLKLGNDWTVDLMLVFNDPNLYGLHLELAGEKAKALANLKLDIMYKKITDDVGVYQIEWTFPDAIRNLNFGAVSVVLPEIGVKIYTNGDFFFDIGFPYNLDFTRSFSVSAIIYGVPVLGAGGFYFGKLSSVTATQVPKTTKGSFNPVIVFGLGLQLGLGYNFVKGPLKAGFAVTVFGILEGVIAAFHPYSTRLPSTGSVQDDYYFKITGTVGIIGLLYGSVDFAIISASVNVKLTLSVSLTYESYQPIPIAVRATVDVSLKVKIDLGLFSFSISFSFSADVSAKWEIRLPNQGTAPWADALPSARAERLRAFAVAGRQVPVNLTRVAAKPPLSLYVTPQFTVMCDEGATRAQDQQGAFVFLMAMDAPSPTGGAGAGGATSFERLCDDYLPWLIGTLGLAVEDADTLDDLGAVIVDRERLQVDIDRMAALDQPPFGIAELLTFLSSFDVTITLPDSANQQKVKDALVGGSVLFPVFDGLSLTVPNKDNNGTTAIDFAGYATTNSTYRANVATLFRQLAALIAAGDDKGAQALLAAAPETPASMAAMVFTDAFMLIGRQLLQAALNALDSYAYPLSNGNSVKGIVDWVNERGNAVTDGDVVTPNADRVVTAGLVLAVPLPGYTVQTGDTLAIIAAAYSDTATPARWATTAEALVLANGDTQILSPGVRVSVVVGKDIHVAVTGPGATFNSLAADLKVDLATLAKDAELYTMAGLLLPGQPAALPALSYTTAAGDTLSGIAGRFGLGTLALFKVPANRLAAPLFDTAAGTTIPVANLDALSTDDLWAAITATDQVSQIAGMMSRFLAFGLRLPSNPLGQGGLTLGDTFLYPATQTAYGLYQLTGQQFPTPPSVSGAYDISLARAASSHGVDLSFITIAGNGAMSLAQAYANLSVVLNYARSGGFQPAPTITVLPSVERRPQSLAVKSCSLWSTADATALRTLCGSTAGDGKAQPILWSLPDSLTRLLNQRTAALSARVPKLADRLLYLPDYLPNAVSSDPATQETHVSPVAAYAYATRVDFTIKKLPAAVFATGQSATLAYTYEVLGPSAADAQLLERLLSAIGELGNGIVSAQFLLMPQGNATATNLLSQANNDFIAYLTQTNLSTETNPPAMLMAVREEAGPRGILNPPDETVKLLWELSTVRSGGYYLTYADLSAGTGLPDAIFDDSGTATLTLVLTYPRDGGKLTNFINAFVTTDTVVQQGGGMTLVAAANQALGLPTLSGDSLAALAALYGIGVGRIAELNPTAALTEGALVPVNGVVHLITPADAAAGSPAAILDALAKYYSVNATAPISGAQIAALNPGVTAAQGVALFIPALVYKVAAAAAPGASFARLAAYYRLSPDALAVAAAAVAGLFPAGTVLNIDTLTYDLQASFGQGNAAFTVVRDNPGLPGAASDPDYANKYMSSLYSVLSAGIDGSPYFDGQAVALPFGPQRPDTDDEHQAGVAHRAAMRRPDSRRARLDALADSDSYDYRQTLGLARRARSNAAVPPPAAGLPTPDGNPYKGVGSFAQLDLTWLDIFGNITVTPFEKPAISYAGSLNHMPLPVRYIDRLVPLSTWPATNASYAYANPTGAGPQLAITLKLTGSIYDGDDGKALAAKHLELFTLVYYQLNQSYKDLGLPWCSGNAVTVSLRNTLFARQTVTLDDTQAKPLRDYVAAAILYLQQVVAGTAATAPSAVLALPVSADDLAAGDIIPLSLTLTFSRDPELVEPSVAALEGGLSVDSAVLPQADTVSRGSSAYTGFAAAFEAIFQKSGGWFTRVGAGTADPGETSDGRSQTLWAVRFAIAAGQAGIRYSLDQTPGYFAPKPIARTLTTATVDIVPTYEPGKPFGTQDKQRLTFSAIDQNAWFESVLKAVDGFLSPNYAPTVFLLDKLLGAPDPLKDGFLAKVLDCKQTLADAIAQTVEPILSIGPQGGKVKIAAAEKLRQALLNQLSTAYGVTAIVGFAVDDARAAEPLTLYGQPRTAAATEAGNETYSFTTGRIPLDAVQADSSLGFLFNSKNESQQAYVPLTLSYDISHVEHDMRGVPGIENYTQSNWIALVSGPLIVPLAGGDTMTIPVLLRALPEPPTMRAQFGEAAVSVPTTPADLPKWTYGFDYVYSRAAQDSMDVLIELNIPNLPKSGAPDPSGDLVTALAQFVAVYPAIEVDMQATLAALDAKVPDEAAIAAAAQAVGAFTAILGPVATAYDAWARPTMGRLAAFAAPQPLSIGFSMVLVPATDDAVAETDIFDVTLNDVPASYDAAAGTISATLPDRGLVTVPAPLVEIDPARYRAVAVPPPSPKVLVAYQYQALEPPAPPGYLSYADALEIAARRVSLVALDAFAHQDAWAAVSVERNRVLFPISQLGSVSTNQTFRFATPQVRFADSIGPRLVHAGFPLDGLSPAAASVEGYLDAFFSQLGSGSGGTTVQVAMEARYSFHLADGIAPTVLPTALLLPVTTGLDGTAPPFVAPLAGMVDQWRRDNHVTTGGDAQVEFSLNVFAADDPAHLAAGAMPSSNRPPLLSIGTLTLTASKVPPTTAG